MSRRKWRGKRHRFLVVKLNHCHSNRLSARKGVNRFWKNNNGCMDITFFESINEYFHSKATAKHRKIAVVTTSRTRQYQTIESNGSRYTLSVYDNFGERNTKRDPVGVGMAMYCMIGTRSTVMNSGDAPNSTSLCTNSPTMPLQTNKMKWKRNSKIDLKFDLCLHSPVSSFL